MTSVLIACLNEKENLTSANAVMTPSAVVIAAVNSAIHMRGAESVENLHVRQQLRVPVQAEAGEGKAAEHRGVEREHDRGEDRREHEDVDAQRDRAGQPPGPAALAVMAPGPHPPIPFMIWDMPM